MTGIIDAAGYIHLDRFAMIGGLRVLVKDDWLLTFEQFQEDYIPESPESIIPPTYINEGIIFLN